jgi:ABC-type multidrug transport system ATPase subunit
MQISLSDTGKRFNRDWIFRHFTFQFLPGRSYAITGPNGSGKSTLLQVIAGSIAQSEGEIGYIAGNKKIENNTAFRHLAIAAPYLELIEEMTLLEFLAFHHRFKPLRMPFTDIAAMVGLGGAGHKQIRYFSSGMKQRIKLGQALFSETSCVLLDEPCTNLDEEGICLYQRLINEYRENRLVIVSSNDIQEYGFCEERIDVRDFRK